MLSELYAIARQSVHPSDRCIIENGWS